MLTFWLAYILTRPLGASIGDEHVPEQPQVRRPRARHDRDELHLPGCILALVAYLSITKRDQTPEDRVAEELYAQSVVPPNPYRVGVEPLTPLRAEERPQ